MKKGTKHTEISKILIGINSARIWAGKKRVFTKEWKEKIKASNKGRIRSDDFKKRVSSSCKRVGVGKWMVGRKHSVETKIKMSIAHKGEKCHLWRGGITEINGVIRRSLKYRLWRKLVFERDNYICDVCKSEDNLEAHHIMSFANSPDLRFELFNGKTLCKKCHSLITSVTK